MNVLKKIFKNLLLIFISTVFTLLILEILLRIFGHQGQYTVSQYPEKMFNYSTVTRLNPNFEGNFPKSELKGHIKINSKGLRDVEKPYKKNGKIRILGLGDSFVFGHGVEFEESFLTILEKKLQNKNDSIEIIKAGAPGIGPQTYYSILQEEGIKYNPDLVLVNIFVGNDIYDIRLPAVNNSNDTVKTQPEQKNKIVPQEKPKGTPVKNFLRKNVHLYSFVVDRLKSIPSIRHKLQEMNIASGMIGSYIIDILKKDYSDEYKAKWDEMFNTLSRMKEITDNLVIVIIPTREQVDPVRLEKALKQLDYKKEDIDIYHPNNLIKDYCKENNILCIDLLPKFQQSTQQPLYFEIDPHFNTEGHKLAAEIIYNELINNNKIK